MPPGSATASCFSQTATQSARERSHSCEKRPASGTAESKRSSLPSPSATRSAWLWRKEVRELALSPSFALLLVFICLLVGHEFVTSVHTYSEMSGTAGGAGAAAQ